MVASPVASPEVHLKKTLLVDMDGTLVDSLTDLAASVNFTLAQLGHPARSMEEVRSFVGNGAVVLLTRSLGESSPAETQEARAIFFEHYGNHLLDHTRVFPGWERVFDSDLALVCATNKPERFAKQILEGLGLTKRFSLLVGGDTLAVKKPDPGVSAYITQVVGGSVHDLAIVGDGAPDGALARACGFPFFGARWGYASEAELTPYAPVWLDGPADLLTVL
jgi:phosphoglycolate phosphatase